MRFLFVGLAALAFGVAALGCSSPKCHDVDLDGYGPHCPAGPDCDPQNPSRTTDCVGVPPPDCVATPQAPGCACFPGTVASCYDAPSATSHVGVCHPGFAVCLASFYGACTGVVLPTPEYCNEFDDDCDGHVDEFVLSPCGGCDPSCTGNVWGPGGTPFVLSPGLVATNAGALTLDRVVPSYDEVWLTNDDDDTVSHISAINIAEVARHSSAGDEPTRVAVDYRGDVFVANASFGAQGTLTKIGGTPAGCIDRNGMNGIETSTGPTDVPAPAADECIVFSVPVGALGEVPRALAVDGSLEPGGGGGGDPWVGLHGGQSVVHLDGETGAFIERVAIPGFRPFAAVFDSLGVLWLASQEGEIVRLDRSTAPPSVERILVNLACYSIYDIDIAADGALVASGFGCNQLLRFDSHTRRVSTLPTLESPRGIFADDGRVYAAHADGRLTMADDGLLSVLGTVDSWSLGAMPVESIGVASDSQGYVWMISSHGGSGGNGIVSRIDPVTRAVTHQLSVGHGPHTLGDCTGRRLRGAFVPAGATSIVIPGCEFTATIWGAIHADLDTGSASSATLDYRWASLASQLPSISFTTLGSYPGSAPDIDLASVPSGGVLELRLTLDSSGRDSAPVIRQIGIQYECAIQ